MRTRLLIAWMVVFLPSWTGAQQAPKALWWDQDATSLGDVQSSIFRYYLDDDLTGVILPNVTCRGDNRPFLCSAPLPVMPQGKHRIQLTMSDLDQESPKSNVVYFHYRCSWGWVSNWRYVKVCSLFDRLD